MAMKARKSQERALTILLSCGISRYQPISAKMSRNQLYETSEISRISCDFRFMANAIDCKTKNIGYLVRMSIENEYSIFFRILNFFGYF